MGRLVALANHLVVQTLLIAVLGLYGCGEGTGVDPVIENFGIAFVKRPVPDRDPDNETRLLGFTPGGDLYFRDLAAPGVEARNITGTLTLGKGDVRDVSVSYDGRKLLFAMRLGDIKGADPADQPSWNLWEYDIDRDTLHRLIGEDITAHAGQDRMPTYLPDGRVVFSSTRQHLERAHLLDEGKPQFGALDERRREPAFVLHIMDADGTNIRQLSFNQSHDLNPVVLEDGHILFSRWDNMGGRNQINLYRIRPDGSGLTILYGAHSHVNANRVRVQFIHPRPMPDGRLMTLLRPFGSPFGAADLGVLDIGNFADEAYPVSFLPTSPGAIALQRLPDRQVRTDNRPSPGGHFRAASPLWDGTTRALVSWSPCRASDASAAILPCRSGVTDDPSLQAARPLYSLFLYDWTTQSQVPLIVPQEGFMFTDVAVAQPRPRPAVIADKVDEPLLQSTNEGILAIRSVYDFDGQFNGMGAAVSDIPAMADPARTLADERPARFLRVIKAVGIPGRDLLTLPGTAFGRSSAQSMREIIGYAPVEPDGSVRIRVPAGVALSIAITDKQGRRISARHRNWIQLAPGEILRCNGCHDHRSGIPHGSERGPGSIYPGATTNGLPFANTDKSMVTLMGETMAETRTRLSPASLALSADLDYSDVWTYPVDAGRPVDTAFRVQYADLSTPAPVSSGCLTTWIPGCRIVINYESHIHPIWSRDRGIDTCTRCHNDHDAMAVVQIPAAQLDLGDGTSTEQPAHFKSYRELLFTDNEQELVMGTLQDRMEQAVDSNGNPRFQTDNQGNQVLDKNGNPIPILIPVTVSPVISTAGAQASPGFFKLFDTGGSHLGRLDPAELKLIAEWIDLGAQYYNDPFSVPR